MRQYLAKRLLVSIVTVLGIVVVVFFIVRVLPGDAAAVRAGPYAGEERIEQIRERYGLSDPIPEQFVRYLGNVATGDLGTSIRTDGSVTAELLQRLPAVARTRRLRGTRRLDCWDSSRNPGCRQGRYRGRQIRASVRGSRIIDGVVLARSLAHLFLLLHAAVVSRPHRSSRGDDGPAASGSPASTRSMPPSPGAST